MGDARYPPGLARIQEHISVECESSNSEPPASHVGPAQTQGQEQPPRSDQIGEMLNACRSYLIVVAYAEMARDVAVKVAPSDLVQDTLMEAHVGFGAFQGQTREELLAWLRQILKNNLLNVTRRFRETASRQVALETPLAGGSSQNGPEGKLTDPWPGPRSDFIQNEDERNLMVALAQLPPIYREVIELRNHQHLSFSEVGARLQRSPEAARKLWARAIELLRDQMR